MPQRDLDAALETQVADVADAVLEAWRRKGVEGTVELASDKSYPQRLPSGSCHSNSWSMLGISPGRPVEIVLVSEPVATMRCDWRPRSSLLHRVAGGFADSVRLPLTPRCWIGSSRSPAGNRPLSKHPPTNERSVMPKKTEYEQGTPSWVDLQTTDQAAGKEFYASLLGWSYDDRPMPQGGTYSMALLNGETVAAIAPMPPGAPEGMPPMWNTYIAVDDIAATVEKVGPAGGQVLMPAMAVGDAGTMAFVADPTGAVVGLWQANQHIGATLVNEPGAIIWNELITDKPESALAFYEAVLGVGTATMEMGPGQTYHLLKVGDTEVGGCMEPPMPGVPNHWHVYFAVPDADATAAQASSAGGQVAVEPFDIPTVGRSAVLTDPQGAMFSVLTPAAQQ